MKKSMFKPVLAMSLISCALFIAGWVMQAQKAGIDIDTISAERFDLLMNIYEAGNTVTTLAVYAAAVAVVGWVAVAIIHLKK